MYMHSSCKEGAEIIVDNTQLTVFGGFAPNSETAQVLSKSLGTCTVMSGSVSQSKNDPSRSLQMIERPLMTADELKSLPKGTFVVTKTGFNPIKVKLKLFFKWGIQFEDKPYVVPLRDNKNIKYANKDDLMTAAHEKYRKDPKDDENEIPSNSYPYEQKELERHFLESDKSVRRPQDVIPLYGNSVLCDKDRLVISKLAEHFQVSYKSMFYRLRDLKMFEPRDIDEYLAQNLGKLGGVT